MEEDETFLANGKGPGITTTYVRSTVANNSRRRTVLVGLERAVKERKELIDGAARSYSMQPLFIYPA